MDPAATLAIFRDEGADIDDRTQAGFNLLTWLRNRGFVPQGLFPPGQGWGGHQAAQRAAIRQIERELAAL